MEGGIPDYEIGSWFGAFLPAGTPPAQEQTLHKAFHRALAAPGMKESFLRQGFNIVGSSPEEFRASIDVDTRKFSRIVKSAGIRAE